MLPTPRPFRRPPGKDLFRAGSHLSPGDSQPDPVLSGTSPASKPSPPPASPGQRGPPTALAADSSSGACSRLSVLQTLGDPCQTLPGSPGSSSPFPQVRAEPAPHSQGSGSGMGLTTDSAPLQRWAPYPRGGAGCWPGRALPGPLGKEAEGWAPSGGPGAAGLLRAGDLPL